MKSSRSSVLVVEWASFKKKPQGKKKNKSAKKQKKKSKPKKDTSKKAVEKEKCFHCNSNGYERRNYPSYLESLKMEKGEQPSEGMLIIESNLIVSSTSSWILDSDSSAHICMSIQGLIVEIRM